MDLSKKQQIKCKAKKTAQGGEVLSGWEIFQMYQKSMGLHSTSMIRSFLLFRTALLMQKTE